LLIGRIRPHSFSALCVAIACLGIATLLRFGFGWLGVSLPFATFYPAVLVTALLAGAPAGVGVMLGAIFIAWWAFIPPTYQFNPLTATDVANFLMFFFSTGCVVALAQWHRRVLQRSHERDLERDLLLQELEHRGRNTYAVVESIVRNTLLNDRASADAIAGRVRAVSAANDLVNQSGTTSVRLKTLLALEFAPNAESRLQASGPDIALSADAARKLGLVFHELTTNAMKHGALAKPEGCVITSWQADSGQVRLSWKEKNGPPVSPPQREGFGTVVVTQSLKSLSGNIAFAFEPDGLCCDMTFGYQ
jgi:two-component sensor histidine kinase